MAITYNLPIRDWYYDTTSEWTLDYPPLFAIFEFFLALIAHLIGLQKDLELSESPIRSNSVIVYQKVTVIISDFVYYYAVYRLSSSLQILLASEKTPIDVKNNSQKLKSVKTQEQTLLDALYKPDIISGMTILLLLQPGLLLVDHIHFQYNGMLSGIFLLSIASIVSRDYAMGSFWFALLLNLKHIYLYCSPAYGMYLIFSYCLARFDAISLIQRTLKLAMIVLAVFTITYLPFANYSIMMQILSRLFPFKRGLTHAYWAPNIWALYNTADKLLGLFNKTQTNFDSEATSKTRFASSTSGLVQEYEHRYLPSVRPSTTFLLVSLFTIPLAIKFALRIKKKSPRLFMKGVTLTAFTAFMFGWHVHEKAIVIVLLPLIAISSIDASLRKTFLRLSLAGTYQLFPLIFEPAEYLTKLSILVAYYYYAHSITTPERVKLNKRKKLYNLLDGLYVFLLIGIEFYITLIHGRLNYSWNPLAKLNNYTFLPLMLTSSFSALGISFSYIELYIDFLSSPEEDAATAAA